MTDFKLTSLDERPIKRNYWAITATIAVLIAAVGVMWLAAYG